LEQCDKLWQDIEGFIENKQIESYFFGSIIINSDNEKLYVIDDQQRLTTFMLLLKALLIKINDVMSSIGSDEDAKSMKIALENRRSEIINCLYSIDKDIVQLVIEGSKPLVGLGIKYDNQSINKEYPNEMKSILQGQSYYGIEASVTRIPYKQKDDRYTNFFRNFKFFCEKIDAYAFDSTKINEFAKIFRGLVEAVCSFVDYGARLFFISVQDISYRV
jgi:hypothetical protein